MARPLHESSSQHHERQKRITTLSKLYNDLPQPTSLSSGSLPWALLLMMHLSLPLPLTNLAESKSDVPSVRLGDKLAPSPFLSIFDPWDGVIPPYRGAVLSPQRGGCIPPRGGGYHPFRVVLSPLFGSGFPPPLGRGGGGLGGGGWPISM